MIEKDSKKQFVLMAVYNAIQYDARVIRSAEAINSMEEKVIVISCNSDSSYENENFESVVFTSKLKGPLLLIAFWFYVLKYSLAHKEKMQLLYVHDYYMVGMGKLISKLSKVNWIYDAHELVIDYRKNDSSKRSLFFSYLEKTSIRNAKLVITANEERKRIVRFIYKLENVISILNITPNSNFAHQEAAREDIIVYQGMMSEERNVSTLIKVLEFLPSEIKLKLIGDGPELLSYKQMVSDMNLNDRVIFTGKIPYSKLLEESKSCKVGIVVYEMESLNTYYCSPNKIYEYAQLNIPMLVSPQPFLKGIINNYKIGEIIYPNEPIEDIAQKTLEIIENFDLYIINMNVFLSDYSYEKEMSKLKAGIAKLLFDL